MRSIRHFRGCMGELLNSLAVTGYPLASRPSRYRYDGVGASAGGGLPTLLEDLGPIDLDEAQVGILVFLAVAHFGWL